MVKSLLDVVDYYNKSNLNKKISIAKRIHSHIKDHYDIFTEQLKEERKPTPKKLELFMKLFDRVYHRLICYLYDGITIITFDEIISHLQNCLTLMPKGEKYILYLGPYDYILQMKSISLFGLFLLEFAIQKCGLEIYLFS
jgi:hypothetical protein